jgi:hypothetical protein
MIKTFFVMLLLVNIVPVNQQPDLVSYRKLMDKAATDSDTAESLYSLCKKINVTDDPVHVGIRAMSEILMCKHVFNPVSKLSHFNRGKKLLDQAISRSKTAPELYFFRFATQSNVPSILKYSSNLDADKAILLKYLKSKPADKDLHQRVKTFMLNSKYCNSQEKEIIKTS